MKSGMRPSICFGGALLLVCVCVVFWNQAADRSQTKLDAGDVTESDPAPSSVTARIERPPPQESSSGPEPEPSRDSGSIQEAFVRSIPPSEISEVSPEAMPPVTSVDNRSSQLGEKIGANDSPAPDADVTAVPSANSSICALPPCEAATNATPSVVSALPQDRLYSDLGSEPMTESFEPMPSRRTASLVAFHGLGHPSDGYIESAAMGVSADGSTVVGYANGKNCYESFRWTSSLGMVRLDGPTAGRFGAEAVSVSADGSIVLGGYESSYYDMEAFRWTSDHGMVGLGDLSGGKSKSYAWGVSADGTTVVGYGMGPAGPEAFRWTSDHGMVGLSDLPGERFESWARGVSADGSIVVGRAAIYAAGAEAFRWTEDGGIVWLGDFAGGRFSSEAYGISADGSTVVGCGTSSSGMKAFRWTENDGLVGLGELRRGYSASCARDVSGDGSTIVGYGWTSYSKFQAFIWRKDLGIISLQNYLKGKFGLDLAGWTLSLAYGISDDGRTIVGRGLNPRGDREAWIVTLPAPPLISAGLDSSLNDIGNEEEQF